MFKGSKSYKCDLMLLCSCFPWFTFFFILIYFSFSGREYVCCWRERNWSSQVSFLALPGEESHTNALNTQAGPTKNLHFGKWGAKISQCNHSLISLYLVCYGWLKIWLSFFWPAKTLIRLCIYAGLSVCFLS